ncbi:hypothetical protein N0V93_005106 [Gnomoniopsis smithogilvyi]|uniref:Protein ECM13 n=1 Tax=Gnomoniopsis smithogilvyi TaxID=1191159 RepID=A0A9W9CXR9_9PEZI|nr:hypothetical protein N0V93_005106 [Gnomoniopsis smithogilvyi]
MSTSNTTTYATPSPLASPVSIIKKQKMSITQTYFLAHKARAKLSNEAAMPDHNLRLLVGHANLLDSLMLELADAEREQESWFNQSVRNASQEEKKANAAAAESRHIQWADSIAEEEEDYDSSSDDDSDISSDEDVQMSDVEIVSLRRVPSNTFKAPASPQYEVMEVDMDDFEEDDYDDEDYADLVLTRTHSHHSTTSPPPELEHDLDESSEDESMPPSPPSTMLPTFEQKQQQQKKSSESTDFFDGSMHYMPTTTATRNPAALVSAISVY